MVSIKWCKKQKKGIKITEPNENIAESYLQMAKDSITDSNKTTTNIWLASTTYYINYYSLYAIMQRIGIKCEIHQCSIEFMKKYLDYNKEEIKLIEETFKIRQELQYYPNQEKNRKKIEELNKKAKDFYIKTKQKINTITEEEIKNIRKKIEE